MNNYNKVADVEFPEFLGININMMPFVMGDFDSIPAEYRHYRPIIEACRLPDTELGKVGYLSIMESVMAQDASQRRGGVHVERHPSHSWGGGGGTPWGGRRGGLYLASNVGRSCKVWDADVDDMGPGGDCSHLVEELGSGDFMEANSLYWIHDRTPHESVPVPKGTRRQWFRVVTSEVGVWYKMHSTQNRLGVKPTCLIVENSKF